MDWFTYLLAAAVMLVLLIGGVIASGLWIGWWRQRRWHDDD